MMSPLSFIDLAHQYGGVLWRTDGHAVIDSVSIDTRSLSSGDCFVAIRGDHFDAHHFLDEALDAGAQSLVLEEPVQKEVLQWVVEDSVTALGQIARENRRLFDRPLIAITGSNGKTTVKEMLASILGASGEVLATQGNLNNHIGVPLTLFRLASNYEYAVVEMGASALGEIEYLCNIAEPDVALVNNVGEAHLEKFGSAENIQQAKGEIYAGLKSNGVAVVNLDCVGAATYISKLEDRKYISFSVDDVEADIYASDIVLDAFSSRFTLHMSGDSQSVELAVPASHNIHNALAAAACAHALDVEIEQIRKGLEAFDGVKGRLQQIDGLNGARIIDDSYNASPTSTKAAVDVLASCEGKKILVLGDMGELGEAAARFHEELGDYALMAGIDSLIATGDLSRYAVDAFGESGAWFATRSELVDYLKAELASDVVLLVKASRSAAMDQVVNDLKSTVES